MYARTYLLFAFWAIQQCHVALAKSQLFSGFESIAPPRNKPPILLELHDMTHDRHHGLFGPHGLFGFGSNKKDSSGNFNVNNVIRPQKIVQTPNKSGVPIIKEIKETNKDFIIDNTQNYLNEKNHLQEVKLEQGNEIEILEKKDPLKISLFSDLATTTEEAVLKTNVKEFPNQDVIGKFEESPIKEDITNISNSDEENLVADTIVFPDRFEEIKNEVVNITKNNEQKTPLDTNGGNAIYSSNKDSITFPIKIMISRSTLTDILQNSNDNIILIPIPKTGKPNQLLANTNSQDGLMILTSMNVPGQENLYTNLPQGANIQQGTLLPVNNNVNIENKAPGTKDIPVITNNIHSDSMQQRTDGPNTDKTSLKYSANDQTTSQYSTQNPLRQLINLLLKSKNEQNQNRVLQILLRNIKEQIQNLSNNITLFANNNQQEKAPVNEVNGNSELNTPQVEEQTPLNIPENINHYLSPQNDALHHTAPTFTNLTAVNNVSGNIMSNKPSQPQNLEQQINKMTTNSLPNNNALIANLINSNIPKNSINSQIAGQQINFGNNVPNNLGVAQNGNGQPMLLYLPQQQGNQFNSGNDQKVQQYYLLNMGNNKTPLQNIQTLPPGSMLLTVPNGKAMNNQGAVALNPALVNSNGLSGQSKLYTRVYIPNTFQNNPQGYNANLYLNNVPTNTNGGVYQIQNPYSLPNGANNLGLNINGK